MNKNKSNLETSELNKLGNETSINSFEKLSSDLLTAQELEDIEGGTCSSSCKLACSTGVF